MINPKDLKEVPLVDMDLEKQNEIINQYSKAERNLKRELEELQAKIDNLKFDLYEKMNIKEVFEVM
ncbi:hypothetical protein GNF67_15360 [Clostridium perfringens]|nr:hypothetical protein [Clostridium perfringens]